MVPNNRIESQSWVDEELASFLEREGFTFNSGVTNLHGKWAERSWATKMIANGENDLVIHLTNDRIGIEFRRPNGRGAHVNEYIYSEFALGRPQAFCDAYDKMVVELQRSWL